VYIKYVTENREESQAVVRSYLEIIYTLLANKTGAK
jgi:hypothetical protein